MRCAPAAGPPPRTAPTPGPGSTPSGSGPGSPRTPALLCDGLSTRCAFATPLPGGTRAPPRRARSTDERVDGNVRARFREAAAGAGEQASGAEAPRGDGNGIEQRRYAGRRDPAAGEAVRPAPAGDLQRAVAMAGGPALPSSESPLHAGLHPAPVHRLDGAARRS